MYEVKHMPTYEGIRLRIQKFLRPKLAARRRAQLKNHTFTIISNNCWGGTVYESYGLQKQSPTVGLFFMPADYIRFVSRLDEYLRAELTFIPPEDSRWKAAPQVSGDKRFGRYPVGRLSLGDENVEIFFLHYHSESEAQEKWTRRCARVDKRRMIVKFNDQNGCESTHIEAFARLPYAHKLFFTARDWPDADCYRAAENLTYRRIRQVPAGDFVRASFEPFGRLGALDVTGYINSL